MDISNEELIKQIQNGINARQNYEQLYKQNGGFIYVIVSKRVHGIHNVDDLMQDAYIALVKAVELYDETKEETSFLQLLKYCLWNSIRDKEQIPAHTNQRIIKYKKMYDKLYSEYGRKPTDKEISLNMRMSLKDIETIKTAMRMQYMMSLDEPIGEDGEATRLDLYVEQAKEDVNFNSNLENENLRTILDEATNKLPDNLREVINKKYFNNLTFTDSGKEKEVSREYIRQLENKALRKLRQDHILRKKAESYIDSYHPIGLSRYKTTWTSSTEWVVLEREKRIEEWKKKYRKE